MRLERLGHIQVMAIATAPAEGPSFGTLESREIDAEPRHRLELVHRIIVADDADELHACEMARRRREKRRRATEDVLGFPEGRFDGVQGDGAYDEKGHWLIGWLSFRAKRGTRFHGSIPEADSSSRRFAR